MVDISQRAILAARPLKNRVDPRRPYLYFVEPERTSAGLVEDVATIFLTNRECPWHCLMCDLWKNTTNEPVPTGAIPEQIDFALARLPAARHVKLYNSGNFFDAKAVPKADRSAIAIRLRSFQTVIVENHPRLCSQHCLRFRDLLGTNLEVAMGLETVQPEVLARLNKGLTLNDFDRAATFLRREGIALRAFILLRPPFMTEQQGVEWAIKSIVHALELGIGCSVVIPVRGGNGIVDLLRNAGQFAPPNLHSLEQVIEAGVRRASRMSGNPRVLAELWELEHFFDCRRCGPARAARLRGINLTQKVPPPVACDCSPVRGRCHD